MLAHHDHAEITVWQANLSDARPYLEWAYHHILATQERERADRFVSITLRNRYVAARFILRDVLSGYCSTAPAALTFSTGPYGKPALIGVPTLHFNLSHSKNIVLLAVSSYSVLGVDVEAINNTLDYLPLVERFFSTAEYAQLLSLEEKERRHGFFRGWVCKEAYVKLLGWGLKMELNRFSVDLGTTDGMDGLLQCADVPAAAPTRCRLGTLSIEPTYMAALAYYDTHLSGEACSIIRKAWYTGLK